MLSGILGLFLLLPLGLAVATGEATHTVLAFAVTAVVAFGLFGIARLRPVDEQATLRPLDAFACVSVGWLVVVLIGAGPYLAEHLFSNPVDAWFESMSGFTTTGATVIPGSLLETLSPSILLWRSLTQWLGGMGIVVLFVALLPSIGAGGSFLVQIEAPGPPAKRLAPRIAASARILWKLYLAMTLVLAALLMVCGMSWFDAICHSFCTVATGGFSTRGDSVFAFSSTIQWVITVFMLLGGVNFALLYLLLRGRVREALHDPELRTYLTVIGLSIVAIALALFWAYDLPSNDGARWSASVIHDKVRYTAFSVVSVITSTGFGTDNFDAWPDGCRVLLVTLMVFGGCAGSTAGGLKLARAVLLAKYVRREVTRVLHPSVVQHIKIEGRVVPEPLVSGVLGLFILYTATWLFGILFLSLLGVHPATAVSASISCLSNIGPGLGEVGPTKCYDHMPIVARAFLPFLMLLGRLEFYAVLMLLVPEMWKRQERRRR